VEVVLKASTRELRSSRAAACFRDASSFSDAATESSIAEYSRMKGWDRWWAMYAAIMTPTEMLACERNIAQNRWQ
jgi:hypothetical protein